MARIPRIDLPGIAQHIVQRGNDRHACFADDADYLHYRQELGEAALKHDCTLHAYVLMTNHVHLLVTPQVPGASSRMMQAIGRRYVGCFNARYRRTGTLWEGRFKSALVDSERYALDCYRYIELNPVRAGMTSTAFDYRWSSHGHNACGIQDPSASRLSRAERHRDATAGGLRKAFRHWIIRPRHGRIAPGDQPTEDLGQRTLPAAGPGTRQSRRPHPAAGTAEDSRGKNYLTRSLLNVDRY